MTQALDLQPIRRRRLSDDIVERIERLMLEGRLAPGDQLPSERELMARFHVGRPAVREALFALGRMGLVAVQNGERAVVTRPTATNLLGGLASAVRHMLATDEGVRQFQDARMLFETALVRRAATTARPEDLAFLRQALERNIAARDDVDAFVATDVAFHLALAGIARNPIFTDLHEALSGWLAEQRTTSVVARGSPESACRAHERIHDAVAVGDADAAEGAMREHLDAVAAFYWQARGSM